MTEGFILKRKNSGFTMVEILIVMAVVMVLATLLVPQYLKYVEQSRQSNDDQYATSIMRAAKVAINDHMTDIPMGVSLKVTWHTYTEEADGRINPGTITVAMNHPESFHSASEVVQIEARARFAICQTMDIVNGENPYDSEAYVNDLVKDAESEIGNGADFSFDIDTSNARITNITPEWAAMGVSAN